MPTAANRGNSQVVERSGTEIEGELAAIDSPNVPASDLDSSSARILNLTALHSRLGPQYQIYPSTQGAARKIDTIGKIATI
jgi:hypothetical protein